MPPGKDKKIASKKPKRNNDTFMDLDEADYRHVTAGKPSVFSKILTKSEISKTPAECRTCWDRLRTRNFQIAGDWYLSLRFASDEIKSWRRSDVSAATIRGELERDPEYLATPAERLCTTESFGSSCTICLVHCAGRRPRP
jgi:hypothetical protein